MEQERSEVYERIPWETLDQKNGDRQWIIFAVAGAVVLGALAYSFMSNRPQAQPTAAVEPVAADSLPEPAELADPVGVVPVPALPPVATGPVVVAEADLFAVNPERLLDQAVAHAEWFVAEYFTVDGSEQHSSTLASLMPEGVPLPTAPDGTRIFVESVGSLDVTELESLRYEVTVLVRYLLAKDDEIYRRQPPVVATVEVAIGDSGPRIALPPQIAAVAAPSPEKLALTEVPTEVGEAARQLTGSSEIVGGAQRADGGWSVVVLTTGADGVTRPVWIHVP